MSFADRAVATLGFHLQQAFARKLATPTLAAPAAPTALPDLRYRVRRDGLRPALLTECFGHYSGVLAPHVLAAAHRLVAGGLVELADARERHGALALAALAHALHGDSVHVIAASDAAAKALCESLRTPLAATGLRIGLVERTMAAAARRNAYACDVVCGTHREIAQDYLRDRLTDGQRPGELASRLQRVAATGGGRLMPQGLNCALVDDGDLIMLDDAVAPAAIAADVDQSRDRLLYEQAVELARALSPSTDFTFEDDGIRLTEPAARLLERLVTPLGGVWSARQRREELVGLALEALHVLQRDVDYRVANGIVQFPDRSKEGEEGAGPAEAIQKLVEVKEGCRLSARREILARLPMPRFFARYRHLAAVCADARTLEGEFWSFYSLKTWLAGERTSSTPPEVRVFVATQARNAALIAAVRAHGAAGRGAVIAVRSPRDAQAMQVLLREAQVQGEVEIVVLPAVHGIRAQGSVSLVVAGLPDSRRHIEQALRACDVKSCELYFALDEEMAARLDPLVARAASFFVRADGELESSWAALAWRRVQRAAERASRGLRFDLRAREQTLDDLLAFSGQRE